VETTPLTEGETKPVVLYEKWAQRDVLVLLGKRDTVEMLVPPREATA
jgi:hypothetical protein